MSPAARIGPPIAASQYGPGNPTPDMSNGWFAAPALQSSLIPLESGGHKASATHSTDCDTEQTLSTRVLAREHQLYPRALRWLVDDLLEIDGARVRQRRGEPQLLT